MLSLPDTFDKIMAEKELLKKREKTSHFTRAVQWTNEHQERLKFLDTIITMRAEGISYEDIMRTNIQDRQILMCSEVLDGTKALQEALRDTANTILITRILMNRITAPER